MPLDDHRLLLQSLGHANPRVAGWRALDTPEHPIPLTLIKARSLERDGVEDGAGAPTLPCLVFGCLHDFAAESIAPEFLGKKDQIDEKQAERCSAHQTSKNLPGRRIRHVCR